MATNEEIFSIFARAISCKVSALNDLDLTPPQRARMLESISDDIKKCTNFIKPDVSHAAREEAARLGVDLSSKNWHDQHRFDPGRKTFHFEHVLPVNALRELCVRAGSPEAIHALLRTKLRVAWILKREDVELTRLGFRSRRADPEAAYREAGIQLSTE
jgi:hypothetical protein